MSNLNTNFGVCLISILSASSRLIKPEASSNSLSNSLELPQYLILTNEAVFLLDNENVLNSLSQLKKYGVKNLVSIESLNYFKHKISNKLIIQATSGDITEKMLISNKLITL